MTRAEIEDRKKKFIQILQLSRTLHSLRNGTRTAATGRAIAVTAQRRKDLQATLKLHLVVQNKQVET